MQHPNKESIKAEKEPGMTTVLKHRFEECRGNMDYKLYDILIILGVYALNCHPNSVVCFTFCFFP